MQFIYFGSSTKCRKFSNFYECKIEYNGTLYRSVEHAFQSQKFNESEKFAIGGDFDNYDSLKNYKQIFYTKKITDEELDKKISYWSQRKCVGVVAKLVSGVKHPRFGLSYKKDFIDSEDLMRQLLIIKFKDQELAKLLVSTEDKILVEFSKSAFRNFQNSKIEKWTGLVKDGVIYGENTMGKLLMEIRESL